MKSCHTGMWEDIGGRDATGYREVTDMLRLTLATEEYLQLGDDIKIAFLGGTGRHLRIMVDAPREVNIARGRYIEKHTEDPEEKERLPKYYAEPETPEKYRRKRVMTNDRSGRS